MTRIASGDTVVVKPSNNVYTVLSAIGTIIVILGLLVLFIRASDLGVKFF